MKAREQLRDYCDNPGVRDYAGLDQDAVCGGGGKQLYSRYILKVEPTKFADQLDVIYKGQVYVTVLGRMELSFTEIKYSQFRE